jgi:hypothetical protein
MAAALAAARPKRDRQRIALAAPVSKSVGETETNRPARPRAHPPGTRRSTRPRRDSQWKYEPARRALLYLEQCLHRDTQWVVSEPNEKRRSGRGQAGRVRHLQCDLSGRA